MTQERLNHLMVLHIHKDLTEIFDIVTLANESVAQHEHKSSNFGTLILQKVTVNYEQV